MYIKKMFECGNVLEIEKIHTTKYKSKKFKREKSFKKSSEAQIKQNNKNAFKQFRRELNANFTAGDYHMGLTYDKYHRTDDPIKAKEDIQKFLRRLRGLYKHRGLELKYLCVAEYGKKGNSIHFHLVINSGVELGLIASVWDHGGVNFRPLNGKGDYSGLASYLMKQATDNYQSEKGVFKKRWSQSSNLVIPLPETQKVSADSWRQDPVIPKGFMLVPDSLEIGVSAVTGYPYQYYRVMRIPGFNQNIKTKEVRRNDRRRA